MILPKSQDAIHKAWMYRVLTAIADNPKLVELLRFKGGTCAAMRGILPRFSIDLDFDLPDPNAITLVQKNLEIIFKKVGLKIADQSKNAPQYFLKYSSEPNARNTLKLDVAFPVPQNNDYEPVRFVDIDRILYCQTIPTMFANKLIATSGRYQRNHSVAGRDLYDVDVFLLKGFSFKPEIIEERTGKKAVAFLKDLKKFIKQHFSQEDIDHDLNPLLPSRDFQRVRKILKQEVLALLETIA